MHQVYIESKREFPTRQRSCRESVLELQFTRILKANIDKAHIFASPRNYCNLQSSTNFIQGQIPPLQNEIHCLKGGSEQESWDNMKFDPNKA